MAKTKVAPHRAGPGLRDTTRLAGSSLDMWAPLLAASPASTLEMLRAVENEIAGLRDAIVRVDNARLRETWMQAQSWRVAVDQTIQHPDAQDPPAPKRPRRVRVNGEIQVPGDKSISHRALMLAALGNGTSRITGILQSEDVHSTARVLRELGVHIPELSDDFEVQGLGLRGLRAPARELDCGNSGTTARLMAGIVAGAGITATFIGDESLSRRPMRRIATPLTRMGAGFDIPENGGLPMTVHGAPLSSIEWDSNVASAQIKSAILLAAAVARVPATVTEPSRSRDHTERMLSARGAQLEVDGNTVKLAALNDLLALDTDVPGDPSSAAFMAAFAAMADGGHVNLTNVCVNETRAGFFQTIHLMGGHMHYLDERESGGEKIATVVVLAGELAGIDIGGDMIAPMIDELPLLACMATRAFGATRITGAGELRVKESDRITAVVNNLRAIGADAEELPDGMIIRGDRKKPLAGKIMTHGDHRLAMAFGVLAAMPGNEIEIDDPQCVAVSYPEFWDHLAQLVSQ
jgi:3-phosphoshikimate 1-carboxyvinyltransferase